MWLKNRELFHSWYSHTFRPISYQVLLSPHLCFRLRSLTISCNCHFTNGMINAFHAGIIHPKYINNSSKYESAFSSFSISGLCSLFSEPQDYAKVYHKAFIVSKGGLFEKSHNTSVIGQTIEQNLFNVTFLYIFTLRGCILRLILSFLILEPWVVRVLVRVWIGEKISCDTVSLISSEEFRCEQSGRTYMFIVKLLH